MKDHTDILTPIRTLAGKVFCDASHQFSPEPVKLEKIYVIEKMSPEENLINCAQLVNNVEVKRLEIVHSFTNIQDMVRVVEEDFEI